MITNRTTITYMIGKMLVDGTYKSHQLIIKDDDIAKCDITNLYYNKQNYPYLPSLIDYNTVRSNNKDKHVFTVKSGALSNVLLNFVHAKSMEDVKFEIFVPFFNKLYFKDTTRNTLNILLSNHEANIFNTVLKSIDIEMVQGPVLKNDKSVFRFNQIETNKLITFFTGKIYTNPYLKKDIFDNYITVKVSELGPQAENKIANDIYLTEQRELEQFELEQSELNNNNPAPEVDLSTFNSFIKTKANILAESEYLKENVNIPSVEALEDLELNKQIMKTTYIGDALAQFKAKALEEQKYDGMPVKDIDPINHILTKWSLEWEAKGIIKNGKIIDRPRYERSFKEYLKEKEEHLASIGMTMEQYNKMSEVWYDINNRE